MRIEAREAHGAPIYKHATADLVLARAKNIGEEEGDGWCISRWATFGVAHKEQRCMQVTCPGVPFDAKADGKWCEWNGRAWVEAPTVHLRPTYHGYGLGKGDQSVHNIYTASDEVRRRSVSPSKLRGRGRSTSPKARGSETA